MWTVLHPGPGSDSSLFSLASERPEAWVGENGDLVQNGSNGASAQQKLNLEVLITAPPARGALALSYAIKGLRAGAILRTCLWRKSWL